MWHFIRQFIMLSEHLNHTLAFHEISIPLLTNSAQAIYLQIPFF